MNDLYMYSTGIDPKPTAENAEALGWCESLYIRAVNKAGKNVNLRDGEDTVIPKWINQFDNHGMRVGLFQEFGETAKPAAIIERLEPYYGDRRFAGLALVCDNSTTITASMAIDYLIVVRKKYPKLAIHLVGPHVALNGGIKHFALATDRSVVNPGKNASYANYHAAYTNYVSYGAKEICPLFILQSDATFGYSYSQNKVEQLYATMQGDVTLQHAGLWRMEYIAYAGKVMGKRVNGNVVELNQLAWTKSEPVTDPDPIDDVETVTLQDITDPAEQHKYLWADFLKRNGISQ